MYIFETSGGHLKFITLPTKTFVADVHVDYNVDS